MTILEEICARKRRDLELTKERVTPRELYRKVEALMDGPASGRSLSGALVQSSTGIIAEFKRRSPSKGWIKESGRPEVIPPSYERAGAAALSILTDEPYFGGSNDYLRTARSLVSLPILRKDFIVDEYQVFEAKEMGADAVLLIAACLGREELRTLAHTARNLGLETLLEIHGESELDYIGQDVSVVGVNNRDLHVFHTDVQTSVDLAPKIGAEFVKISESGIKSAGDIRMLRMCGYSGFLMGERFMCEVDPGKALAEFIAEI